MLSVECLSCFTVQNNYIGITFVVVSVDIRGNLRAGRKFSSYSVQMTCMLSKACLVISDFL